MGLVCQPIAWDAKLDWMAHISRGSYFIWRQLHNCTKVKILPHGFLPTYVNEVPYARAKDIFSSANKLR